jgi:phosphopantothenoylcysteine decarboxylase/phosphopantothenate--cysteine ligase
MNTAMYENAATQESIKISKERGYYVMDTGIGALACRDEGAGRMKEPDEILEYTEKVFESLYDMQDVKVLVSAGPTIEDIDPVRFISNRSSGKMGYEIASSAVSRGADVTLVSGPVSIEAVDKAKMIYVRSAAQMYKKMTELSKDSDVVIMCAAVADYTPKDVSSTKIKKGEDTKIELVRTKDILKELGSKKKPGQIIVGFAAETNDHEKSAKEKLMKKNLDIIALNDVSRQEEGFGSDNNNIKLFFSDGSENELGSKTKHELSKDIINSIFEYRKTAKR